MSATEHRLAILGWLAGIAALLAPAAGLAQSPATDQPPADVTLPPIEVIGVSPIMGTGIDRDKVPANTRSFSPTDLGREGTPDLTGTLARQVPSVNLNDVQDSPQQPDVQYRGFNASPVTGTPQGLAIYQNGVRINEAFGDTVNWDLVPDFAINRVNLMSSNPAFGLNALGGALALEMKNGFNFSGGQASLSGGSFDHIDGIAEYGVQSGHFGSYIGTRNLYDGGWRDHSPSSIHQLYADLGAEGERLSGHISFAGASNLINAIGPTPVELLAASRSAVYTTPQSTRNDLAFLTLSGSYKASDSLSIDSNAYYRHFRQRISNGNTTEAQPCTAPPGFLCFGNGTTPLNDLSNTQIPASVLNGQTPGEIDGTETIANGVGGSLQMTETAPVLGHGNHLVAGLSIDHGLVDFRAQSELGFIEPSLLVSGTGFTINDPASDLAPVSVTTTNGYYGLYASDTFDVTNRLALTASGRYNLALISLDDHLGTSVSGDHRYSRFNPAIGATYKLLPQLTAYAGYAETNRAPTPGELACADPARPCIIDNFLVSDPNLKQVVARTYEAGLRGTLPGVESGSRVAWYLGVFRTDDQDEILNVPSTISGFGFFRNVGNTRRQGIESGANYRSDRWLASIDYTFLDATFQSPITLSSPNNPFADADGNIAVKPGDHIPSLPTHRLKLGLDYGITEKWRAGADLVVTSGQYLRGDESNQNPKIPGYHVLNLHTSYAINDHFEVFGLIRNLFNEKYATFGTFFNTAQIPSLALSDPRTVSPGTPRSFFAGVKATF